MDEAANHDPLIGATLGGLYHVERLLGVGGMGRVYRATHALLGKEFAIKVLPEARADKQEATERFLREARAVTQVDHEHIVKVVNVDEDDQHRLFIVMELLEGENLADRLKRGPLPLDDALRIATQTGEALQAAHDAGIVHRDLKPENIFLATKSGRDVVKVLDFGISKFKDPGGGDPKLTATDRIVGTPLYISPELARGMPEIDHRTDIYALGVILYEMLTGTPPFSGQNHFQLLYKHGNESPDPPSHRSKKADIPPHVEAAVLRALEKNPDDRFAHMRDFCAALQGRGVRQGRRTRWVVPLVAIVFAGVAFVFWPKPAAEPTDAPTDSRAPESSAPAPAPVTEKSGVRAEAAEPSPEPEQVSVKLESVPRGAWVTLDGKRLGKTPLAVELDRGSEATVRFSLRGYTVERRRFVAGEREALRVRLEKKRRPPPPPIKTEF